MLHIQTFTFNPFSQNTFVVFDDEKNACIVDPGNFDEKETATLQNFITVNNLTIKNILLTHAHIDHVFGLQWVFERYKVPVLMHENDKEILDRNPIDAQRFGFRMPAFEGEISFLNEGEKYSLGTSTFEILHVPGHSPGSIAFWCEDQKFIISGDVLFEGSIGRTDLYKGNPEELLNSIKTKLFTLPEETKVYPGHGNPTQIGFEKKYNPFLN